VQRVFPNRLRVTLEEHHAMAWWEQAGTTLLLNQQGEVFEASAEDEETDGLPELLGPKGQATQVKQVFEQLLPLFAHVDMRLERLELTAQGSWRAGLDNGASVEMGRGDPNELSARVRQFTLTLPQVTREHGRSLESADLRYPAAYAVRLRGISTLAPGQVMKPAALKPRPAVRQ
jgi:cell division protein FtsQ